MADDDAAEGGAPADSCDCVRLDPADWDRIESDWSDIQFLKGSVAAVMGVPLRYDVVRRDLERAATKAGAVVPEGAMLLIGEGRFRRPVLLEIEGAPGTMGSVASPGGVAFTRLVSAPWGEMKARVAELNAEVRVKYGRNPDRVWTWFLTCNVCSHDREFETLLVAHLESR